MRRTELFRSILILTLLLLSACDSPNQALPTLAQFPTVAPVATASATAEQVVQRPTLPPEWTKTPTLTVTASATITDTPSVTPSATITDTPSPTATDLGTIPPDERARTSLLEDILLDATRLPPGGFIATPPPAFTATLTVPVIPGIPTIAPPTGGIGQSPTPPSALSGGSTACPFYPAGGFGAIFANNPDIAVALGCPEGSPPDVLSLPAAWQPFQQGLMIWLNGEIFVLKTADNSFQRYPDTYVAGTDPETSSELPPSGLMAPVRGFLKVWSTYTEVRPALGWGVSPENGVQATVQRFARGRMVWLPGRSDILVFMGSDANIASGTWRSFTGQF